MRSRIGALLGVIALFAASPAVAIELNVKDFGAVGDGLHDDTAAIQAALDLAATSGGGTVLLPAGTWVVAPSLEQVWLSVGSRTTVRGAGENATVLRVRDGAGDYRAIFGQAAPSTAVRHVRFQGFRIDQNPSGNVTANLRAGTPSAAQNALYFTAFDGLIVEDVAVDPAAGVNTFSLNGPSARGAVIRGCRVRFVRGRSLEAGGRYDNSAIYLHGERFLVEGNRFENGGQPGDAVSAIEVHGGPGGVVSGNQIAGYLVGVQLVSGGIAEPELASNDLAVVGNAIVDAALGIQLWGLTGRALRGVNVSANVISIASATLPSTAYAGIALHDEGVGGQVLGDLDGIVISGNTVTMARVGRAGYSPSESAGIRAAPQGSVRNLVIADNVVRGAPSQGIRVESKRGTVRGLAVRGNLVVDAGGDQGAGPYRIGMIFAGKVTGALVRGNVLVDSGTPLHGLIGLHTAAVAPGSELQLEGNVVSRADTGAALAYVGGQAVFAQRRVALPYGPVVTPDATRGRTFVVTCTDGAPFTIASGVGGVPGQRIALHVRNGSGGALGPVTWLPGYRLAGSWVAPANGYGRLLELEWDGASWVELSRSAGDVPN